MLKRPAYARALTERLATGAPVALVVIAVHDWQAGRMVAERPGVVRLVIPPDVAAAEVDLSLLAGHDVLIVGGDLVPFLTLSLLALRAQALSVWGEYEDGICRAALLPSGRLVTTQTLPDADALLQALPALRVVAAIAGDGIFAEPAFRPARAAAIGQIFGPRMAERFAARPA